MTFIPYLACISTSTIFLHFISLLSSITSPAPPATCITRVPLSYGLVFMTDVHQVHFFLQMVSRLNSNMLNCQTGFPTIMYTSYATKLPFKTTLSGFCSHGKLCSQYELPLCCESNDLQRFCCSLLVNAF